MILQLLIMYNLCDSAPNQKNMRLALKQLLESCTTFISFLFAILVFVAFFVLLNI